LFCPGHYTRQCFIMFEIINEIKVAKSGTIKVVRTFWNVFAMLTSNNLEITAPDTSLYKAYMLRRV
jgi:hypothetical protein